MIRVVLPANLRTLAGVKGEVALDLEGPVTQRSVLDALEASYPMLRGTIRDHATQLRRPFLRFFACEEDLSHEPPDARLPDAVASGTEPFMVIGAIAGGQAEGEMAFIETSELPAKEPLPGWVGRFFHSEHMTFAYYEIAPGSGIHRHRHPNEEVWNIIEGELEMVVGDATRIVRGGDAVVIPADVEHAASPRGRCRAIVVDHPVRDMVGGVDIR